MLAAITLEVFGDDTNQLTRSMGAGALIREPWVARITGRDPKFRWRRQFERGSKDYGKANGVGSRGVYLTFWLPTGVYEVYERTSWRRGRRYFCRVTSLANAIEVVEIEESEVLTWLTKDPSASTC